MKKLLALLLTALLLPAAALAEPLDLTGYTMDELVTLRQQVDAAMLNLTRSVDRSDATLDGLVWVSNGAEVRINAYEGTATEVVVPAEINGLPVTQLQTGAFCDCTHVTSVTLPDTITEIPDDAFHGCSKMTTVHIPSAVTSIGYAAFQGCTKLTSVAIPSGVTYIGGRAFCDCDVLQTVTLPEGLMQLGNRAFCSADELGGVIVLPSTLTSVDAYTFSNCKKMLGVVIQSDLTPGHSDFSGESLEFVYIREGAAVNIKHNDIFHRNLRVIVIPASVTNIVPGAFERCNHLTVVTPAGSYAEQYCRDNWIVCNTQDYDKYVAEYEAYLQ